MKKYLLMLVLWGSGLVLIQQVALGQDPNFSQFFNAPSYYNPALTGLNTGLKASFTFRNQWPNLPSSFKSYFFSADLGDRNLPGSGGLGIIVNSDNQAFGFIRNLAEGINMSVRIPLSDFVVSQVGIRASVVQKSVNWDDFVFTDQLSEKYGNIYTSSFQRPESYKKIFPDFAVGGLLQFSNEASRYNGTIGLSVDHIFRPDEGFLTTETSPLPRKWVAHTNFIITTGDGNNYSGGIRGSGDPLKLNPGIIYQNQDGFSTLQAGMNLLKYNIYLGGWYKDALGANGSSIMVLVAGYRYQFAEDMNVKFMYSYDFQISGAAMGAGGAHEVTMILSFDKFSLFGSNGNSGYSNTGHRKFSALECSGF
jgi:type IX secretion system PorP/SprF family membrane protein